MFRGWRSAVGDGKRLGEGGSTDEIDNAGYVATHKRSSMFHSCSTWTLQYRENVDKSLAIYVGGYQRKLGPSWGSDCSRMQARMVRVHTERFYR